MKVPSFSLQKLCRTYIDTTTTTKLKKSSFKKAPLVHGFEFSHLYLKINFPNASKMGQWYFDFAPAVMSLCCWSYLPFWLNVRWQYSQTKDLVPSCNFRCLFSNDSVKNLSKQCRHRNGFSSLCFSVCCCRSCAVQKNSSQILHSNCFSRRWSTAKCAYNSDSTSKTC